MQIAEEVARILLQINAIKISPQNPFTWASGLYSPMYCDNRILLSYPDERTRVKKLFEQRSADFGSFEYIAGVATGGIPLGALLADQMRMPFAYVRSATKGHGKKNRIEGMREGNYKVLVIEDLISTGSSSLKAVDSLRDRDCGVMGILAIFSYGLDVASENFEKANCRLETLTNFAAMIDVAEKMDLIDKTDIQLLKDWRKDPIAWSDMMKERAGQ
jgi:orotate phosphoribosyltransferase